MYDFGTIFLVISVILAVVDILLLVIGPRLLPEDGYEKFSFISSGGAFLATTGAFLFMALLIFSNDITYNYVVITTKSTAPILLKISALWAGAQGSLLFWAFIAFILYFGFRYLSRGYEDDIVVYRAILIMSVSTILIIINTLITVPFAPYEGPEINDGYGLNPLLSTILNVIHPPIVFVAYALLMVPFAIKLAGFTVSSELRHGEQIPIMERYSSFCVSLAWLMLSMGIVIGAYWAYTTLGWGGYWGWDPVETSSLIPWLLLTGYYHAKAIFKDSDVLRDSFLIFSYITVLFATWITRSGILTSVHGFTDITPVTWSMLATLLGTFIVSAILTVYAGYRDMDEEEETSGWPTIFSMKDIRKFSIFIAFIGILIVSFTSFAGVALPATINLGTAIFNPTELEDNLVGINVDFFWVGFYIASFFLIISAFYCMRNTAVSVKVKSIFAAILVIAGIIFGLLSYLNPDLFLPTNSWMANLLVPLAIGAIIYLGVTFVRYMAGRESGVFTMRQLGRIMLHLGLVMLLLGVFMSSNIEYQSTQNFVVGIPQEIAPGINLEVHDFGVSEDGTSLVAEIRLFEGNTSFAYGYASVTAYPGYTNLVSNVYIYTSATQDIYVAISRYTGSFLNVDLQTKIIPMVSFVWLGTFFMIFAIFPLFIIESSAFMKAIRGKEEELYEDEEYEEIGDVETDVVAHLEKLLKSDAPEELLRKLSMTPLLISQNRYSEAEADLKEAVEIFPDSVRSWFILGAVLNRQEKYSEAEQAFRHAVELDPGFGEAWYMLAGVLSTLEKSEEAREALMQAKLAGYDVQ